MKKTYVKHTLKNCMVLLKISPLLNKDEKLIR